MKGRRKDQAALRLMILLAVAAVTIAGSDSITRAAAATEHALVSNPGRLIHTEVRPPATIALSGRFEAEDYRDGGEGIGYSDMSALNLGGEYRTDAVDIQTTHDTSGDYNIGWIGAGEWLAYDVEVDASGDYVFSARVATIYDCRSVQRFHIELDGTNVTGPIAAPNTGGWQRWADAVSRSVSIPAGSYTLKFVAETAGFNLNYIEMREAPSLTTGPITLPGQFEAEDYRAGGPGVGFHDTTDGNYCGANRGDDVDIQICDDGQDPCYNVGWVDQGEWLAYDVQVDASGDYMVTMRTATIQDNRAFRIELDGINVSGSITVPNTGGWHAWTDVTSDAINLAAGSYTLKIVAETGQFNMNHVQVRVAVEATISAAPRASLTHLFLQEG